jgi:opacity protein-like surface antigen
MEVFMFKKFSRILGIIVLLSTFCFSVSALADDYMQSVYNNGFYLGVQVNYMSVSGSDFDGQTFLATYDEAMFIPELDPSVGFGGLIGLREGPLGMELSFITSSPTGTILGDTGDAKLTLFNLYFKYWLDDTSSFQPYFLFGVDLNLLSATDAAVLTDYPYTLGDTDLTGVNLDLGAGISYYITPQIAINAGANIHFMIFSSVSGVLGDTYDLDEYVTGSLINIYGGFTFCLE